MSEGNEDNDSDPQESPLDGLTEGQRALVEFGRLQAKKEALEKEVTEKEAEQTSEELTEVESFTMGSDGSEMVTHTRPKRKPKAEEEGQASDGWFEFST